MISDFHIVVWFGFDFGMADFVPPLSTNTHFDAVLIVPTQTTTRIPPGMANGKIGLSARETKDGARGVPARSSAEASRALEAFEAHRAISAPRAGTSRAPTGGALSLFPMLQVRFVCRRWCGTYEQGGLVE